MESFWGWIYLLLALEIETSRVSDSMDYWEVKDWTTSSWLGTKIHNNETNIQDLHDFLYE